MACHNTVELQKENILTIHNEISEYFCDLGHLEEDNRMLG